MFAATMRRWINRAETFRRSRQARFCAASFNGVVITQVLLILFVHGLGWSPATSNVIAVTISCVPSFMLNRYWVRGHGGTRNLGPQIMAFWAMALVGLALSTAMVSWLAAAWDSPLVANIGNIAGFGALWVAKYLVLDRLMFRPLAEPAAAVAPATAP
jgi:putative flippase GtrA